jgi:hypothetical protein
VTDASAKILYPHIKTARHSEIGICYFSLVAHGTVPTQHWYIDTVSSRGSRLPKQLVKIVGITSGNVLLRSIAWPRVRIGRATFGYR